MVWEHLRIGLPTTSTSIQEETESLALKLRLKMYSWFVRQSNGPANLFKNMDHCSLKLVPTDIMATRCQIQESHIEKKVKSRRLELPEIHSKLPNK